MTDVDVKCVPDDIGKDTQQNKADHGMILPLLSDYSETVPNGKINKQGRYFFPHISKYFRAYGISEIPCLKYEELVSKTSYIQSDMLLIFIIDLYVKYNKFLNIQALSKYVPNVGSFHLAYST